MMFCTSLLKAHKKIISRYLMKKVTSMRDGTRKIRKVKKIRMIQKKG